jgi:laccase
VEANVTVNCQTKPIVTVNGWFPGPTIYVNDGDRIIVNVTNKTPTNMTVHFHGLRQPRSPWMDGVAYITMCPVQPGDYFVHDFIVELQRGTLLWHAHIGWQRATVHGAFVIYDTAPTPYKPPDGEFNVILGKAVLLVPPLVYLLLFGSLVASKL